MNDKFYYEFVKCVYKITFDAKHNKFYIAYKTETNQSKNDTDFYPLKLLVSEQDKNIKYFDTYEEAQNTVIDLLNKQDEDEVSVLETLKQNYVDVVDRMILKVRNDRKVKTLELLHPNLNRDIF